MSRHKQVVAWVNTVVWSVAVVMLGYSVCGWIFSPGLVNDYLWPLLLAVCYLTADFTYWLGTRQCREKKV